MSPGIQGFVTPAHPALPPPVKRLICRGIGNKTRENTNKPVFPVSKGVAGGENQESH